MFIPLNLLSLAAWTGVIVVWLGIGLLLMRRKNGPGGMIAMVGHEHGMIALFLLVLFIAVWPLQFRPFNYLYLGGIWITEKASDAVKDFTVSFRMWRATRNSQAAQQKRLRDDKRRADEFFDNLM